MDKEKGRRLAQGRGGFEVLTQGAYKCQVLQHHIMIQAFLRLIKKTPFLPGKVHGHIFKSHTTLSQLGQMKSQTSSSQEDLQSIPLYIYSMTILLPISPVRGETRPWCHCIPTGPLIMGSRHQRQETGAQTDA